MSDFDKRNPLSIDQQNRINDNDSSTNQSKYDPYEDPYWWTICGFYNRLRYGRLYNIFFSSDKVVVVDIDSIVNIFALVDALIVAIPIGLIGSTKYADWDGFEKLAYSCNGYFQNGSKGPYGYYHINTVLVYNNCMCTIYSAILCLGLTVIYYVSRPSEERIIDDYNNDLRRRTLMSVSKSGPYDREGEALINKTFRSWWKRGRIILLILFAGTTTAVISLVCLVNVYYEIFFTSSNAFCNSYGRTEKVKEYFGGFYTIAIIFGICFYVVI